MGVFPIASTTLTEGGLTEPGRAPSRAAVATCLAPGPCRLVRPTGHRRKEDHRVVRSDCGLQPLAVSNIAVVDVDVDERRQLAAGRDTIAERGEAHEEVA